MQWTELIPNGQATSPTARDASGSLVRSDSDFYLFGGWNGAARNDFWRLSYEKIGLSGLQVSPNPVKYGEPFNFSWGVNAIGGSTQHVATVLFNGGNYTGAFPNTLGSIMLQMNQTLKNFTIQLLVRDASNPRASVAEAVNFNLWH